MPHSIETWCLLCSLLILGGCGPGGPEIASVEGTVTMDGKPLANATVVFSPMGGRPAGARTDQDGHYVLNFGSGRKGAMPGINKIRITTVSEAFVDEDGKKVPGSRETIPVEYNQSSTLEFDVKAGEKNLADFNLKSGGKVIDQSGY